MRRILWIISALALIAISTIAIFRREPTPLPAGSGRGRDVILITIDTTRFDRLGCYGAERDTSPTIDRYAREGLRFESAYAATPVTLPSHASIMTGLTPPEHGVRNNGTYRLGDAHTTLAERLSAEGYRTGAFVSAFVLAKEFGLAQGFDHYDEVASDAARDTAFTIPERPARETVDRALAWIEQQPEETPTFIWLHFFDPHAPYTPPPEYGRQFGSTARDRYDAEIRAMDAAIGHFRSQYPNRGREALTIILSDHGEGFGDHGEASHGVFLYQETLRIPLIVHAPGLIEPGVSTRVGRQIDVMPTVLELLGAPLETTRGTACSLLDPDPPPEAEWAYLETVLPFEDHGWSPLFGIVQNGWKYIEAPQPELYQIDVDPSERKNLMRTESARAEKMARSLAMTRQRLQAEGAEAERLELDETQRSRLEAVGYIAAGGLARPGEALPDPKEVIGILDELESARALLGARRSLEAFEVLAGILDRNPGNATALELLGYQAIAVAARHQGESRQQFLSYALRAFREWTDRAPDQPDGPYGLGLVARLSGKTQAALAQHQAVLEKHPEFMPAIVSVLAARLSRNEYPEARELGERAIAIDPESYEARYNLAVACYRSGDAEAAVTHFQRIYPGRSPSEASLLSYWLGESFMALERWSDAHSSYRNVRDPSLRQAKQVDRKEADCAARIERADTPASPISPSPKLPPTESSTRESSTLKEPR